MRPESLYERCPLPPPWYWAQLTRYENNPATGDSKTIIKYVAAKGSRTFGNIKSPDLDLSSQILEYRSMEDACENLAIRTPAEGAFKEKVAEEEPSSSGSSPGATRTSLRPFIDPQEDLSRPAASGMKKSSEDVEAVPHTLGPASAQQSAEKLTKTIMVDNSGVQTFESIAMLGG